MGIKIIQNRHSFCGDNSSFMESETNRICEEIEKKGYFVREIKYFFNKSMFIEYIIIEYMTLPY